MATTGRDLIGIAPGDIGRRWGYGDSALNLQRRDRLANYRSIECPVTAITRNCGMLYLLSVGPHFQLLDRLQQPRPLLLSVIERATMLEG